MPKPTFLQSVLGRPSRSYVDHYEAPKPANPYNPYKEYPSTGSRSRSRRGYAATDVGYYGHEDYGQPEAGPSRRRAGAGGSAAHSALGYAPRDAYSYSSHPGSHYAPTEIDGESMGYARSDLGLGYPPDSRFARQYSDYEDRRAVSDPSGPLRTSESVPVSLGLANRSGLPDVYGEPEAEPGPPRPPPKPYYHRPVHVVNPQGHKYEYGYEPSPPSSTVSSVRSRTAREQQRVARPGLPNFASYDAQTYDAFKPPPPTPVRTPHSSAPSTASSAALSVSGSGAESRSASGSRSPASDASGSLNASGSLDARRVRADAVPVTESRPSVSASSSAPPTSAPTSESPDKAQVPTIVMDASDPVAAAESGRSRVHRRSSVKSTKSTKSTKSYKSGKSLHVDVSDSEDDVFHTPRSSFDFSAMGHETEPHETPVSEVTVLPTLKVQPPTPMHDLTTPPLERELRDPWSEEADDVQRSRNDVKPPSPTVAASLSPKPASVASLSSGSDVPPPVPPKSPRKSRGGRVRGAHMTILNGPGMERPLPPPKHEIVPLRRSKSAKNVGTKATSLRDLPLRPSSRAEFRTMSEVPPPRGTPTPPPSDFSRRRSTGSVLSEPRSDGVRTAGYGKGGWAAASAEPVVMYMPANGSDGWAAFHPQPPRSRFSVLPPSQMPAPSAQYPRQHSFGSGSTGSSSLGPSASASQDGRYYPSPPTASPTSGLFGPRRYEPSALSRSSSMFDPTEHLAPAPAPAPPSLTTSPAPTEPITSPDDSDDEWDGERPSRSYIRKTEESPTSPTTYNYGSEVGTAPRSESVVKFDFGPEHRYAPTLSYDPYSDSRAVPPRARAESPQPMSPQPMSPQPMSPPSHSSGSIGRSSRHSVPASAKSYSERTTPRLPQLPFQVPLDPALRALGVATPPPPSETPETVSHQRVNLDRPSSINPDLLTFLPVMSSEASDRLYSESEHGHRRWASDGVRNGKKVAFSKGTMSDVGYAAERRSRDEDAYSIRRSNSINRTNGVINLDGPETIQVAEDDTADHPAGYTNLVLPHSSTYAPLSKPKKLKDLDKLDTRIPGLPHSSMAAITLSSSFQTPREREEAPTPAHLKHNLPPPVEFTSHVPPPAKVGSSQVMVQVYAVAVDEHDIAGLDDKGLLDIGKFIPGRSFVGRALVVGEYENDLQRGDLVIGLLDIRKSGALCEYLIVDRRRIARVPSGDLTLEQLALLPLQGIATLRALRGVIARGARALVMDAHEGVPALMCQEMARRGVHVTAVVAQDNVLAQAQCIAHGARGYMAGSPAAVMLSMDEGSFHVVVDTRGGTKVYEAARRALVDGGHLICLSKDSGKSKSRSIRWGFKRTRITTTYVPAPGTGEPTVDSSGLDPRDVMEEEGMDGLAPVVGKIVPFERGAEVFTGHGGVVRIIN